MSDDEGCPHGLDERWCSVCLHGPSKMATVQTVSTFEAKFDGWCSVCRDVIDKGARICKLSDDTYAHQDCTDGMNPGSRRTPV